MRKKLFTIALSAIMVIAMAVPAFAWDADGWPHYAAAWNGAQFNGSYMMLHANGRDRVLSVVPLAATGSTWELRAHPHGGYVFWHGISTTECANIYRVKVGGIYYNSTLYIYEGNGKDQRVASDSNGQIRLYDSSNIGGGTWYLQTDKTNIAGSSDVIWYTNSSGAKTMWSEVM